MHLTFSPVTLLLCSLGLSPLLLHAQQPGAQPVYVTTGTLSNQFPQMTLDERVQHLYDAYLHNLNKIQPGGTNMPSLDTNHIDLYKIKMHDLSSHSQDWERRFIRFKDDKVRISIFLAQTGPLTSTGKSMPGMWFEVSEVMDRPSPSVSISPLRRFTKEDFKDFNELGPIFQNWFRKGQGSNQQSLLTNTDPNTAWESVFQTVLDWNVVKGLDNTMEMVNLNPNRDQAHPHFLHYRATYPNRRDHLGNVADQFCHVQVRDEWAIIEKIKALRRPDGTFPNPLPIQEKPIAKCYFFSRPQGGNQGQARLPAS